MSDTRRSLLSGWARAAISGVALGLMLLLTGDRARTACVAGGAGIDPLEILKLQVRPNVIVTLDTSGSMASDLAPSTDAVNLTDMHTRGKLQQAKDTLLTFITDNQASVSFQFGTYNQTSVVTSLATGAFHGDASNRFIYTAETPAGATQAAAPAAAMQINPAGSGASTGRAKRSRCLTDPLPTAPGTICGDTQIDVDGTAIHRLFAGRFFNGQTLRFTSGGSYCSTTNGTTTNPATVILQQVASCGGADTGAAVRFTFQGGRGDWYESGSSCVGFFSLVPLQACTNLDQVTAVQPFLAPSLKINADGSIAGYTETATFGINTEPTFNGLRAAGATPIANSLIDIKTIFDNLWNSGQATPPVTAIKNQNPKQRTFLIFVTDGDDTCGTSGNTADQNALRAAHKAELLSRRIVAIDPASGVPSFVILFGSGPSKSRGDWIAYGGSGMSLATTGTGTATRWANPPTAAQINACTTCQPAFAAASAQDLADALRNVINQVIGQGEFSASSPIVGTVFELVVDPDLSDSVVVSPLNPTTRYSQRINILYQSTFNLPGWEGRLFAFRNDGSFQNVGTTTNSLGIWEAGQTLHDKVTTVLQSTDKGHGLDELTFAELHGGATARSLTSALIKRRIFTSNGNGTFARTAAGASHDDPQFNASQVTGTNVVALWPPNQSQLTSGIADIDPAVGTVGPLDAALGIASLTFAELQGFGACLASTDAGFGPAPAACNFGANATLATNAARKEVRQRILAYVAGAQLSRGTDGLPRRTPSAATEPNAWLFTSRDWLLLDSENAAVAVASPPLQFSPAEHVSEFILYRDGRRQGGGTSTAGTGIDEIDLGFGLRNPDFDDLTPQNNLTLKPVMTVVYFGGNDGVHAFRAGPQCVSSTNCTSGEQGSEELWSYIPFDQLFRLADMMRGQETTPHQYMIASNMRLASVFIPDADGFSVAGASFTGRWRTVLVFGRGFGGKYYTALDVTVPGRFTTTALNTNPPWVMWSRGNPDTLDGTTGGTPSRNATDTNFYKDMGQTWSVPAIGAVQLGVAPVPAELLCSVGTPRQAEWRVFVGSGYGDTAVNSNEGKRFYQLDAVTGDVCQTSLLPNGSTTYICDNALVAGPSGYNPKAQDPPGSTTRDPIDYVTRIYQPDLHGRIWRFSTASGGVLYDAGPAQPIANSVALLKIGSVANVFAESGNDTRVDDSVGPFKAFGVRDPLSELVYSPPPLGTTIPGFPFNLDTSPASGQRIRGTVQPLGFFNDAAAPQPRVFFAGTRFIPAGVGSCLSSFDTILFAVSGNSGGAVYDFTGDGTADLYTILQENKTPGLLSGGGSVIVGKSGSIPTPPPPTPNPFPTPTPGPPKPPTIMSTNLRTNSPVCRTP